MRLQKLLDDLRLDSRYAVRQLLRAPGFTLVAGLTLGLGIGATTAIFSAVNAVILRPLPYHESDRLVRIYSSSRATTDADELSPRTFTAWRRQNRSFERLAAIETRSFTFSDGASLPERLTGVRATADYFPMLGVQPLRGRAFGAAEDRPGANAVAVLSYRLWITRFGGTDDVLGRTVRINAVPHRILGVMPASFDVGTPVDLWMPIGFTPEEESVVETGYLDVVGRLRPGIAAETAEQELTVLTRRLDEERGGVERSARVVPFASDLVGGYRNRLFLLLGSVGLVLLIACANVANLLLARGAGRARETALRAALGAGRGRVVRQMVAESLVLSGLGGAAGLGVAYAALRLLARFGPDGVPRLDQASIDGVALGFTLAVSVLSGLGFGLVPAFRAASPDLHDALKQGGRSGAAAVRDRVRQSLVVAEVALSIVLLIGAGLLIRSALLLQKIDPGLDPANLWSGAVTLPAADYRSDEQVTLTFEGVLDGVRALPGVESAALVSVPPFSGLRALGLFVPEGRPVDERNTLMANLRLASPGLFRTLAVSLESGRDFAPDDAAGSLPVIMVNRAFADLAWPGEPALGKRLLGAGGRDSAGRPVYREVVGVVGNTREDGLREAPRPAVYYPIRQAPSVLWGGVQNSLFVVARAGGDFASTTRRIQDVVTAIDRGLPVFAVASMEERMADLLATARFTTQLLTALGVAGLLLAMVGIYGVVAYLVSQRTQEIGVRLALGATPSGLVAMVVRQGMRPVLIGIAAGVAGAVLVTRLMASQLYGVAATDPLTFAGVAVLIATVAAAASAIPALRAARVDPRQALGM